MSLNRCTFGVKNPHPKLQKDSSRRMEQVSLCSVVWELDPKQRGPFSMCYIKSKKCPLLISLVILVMLPSLSSATQNLDHLTAKVESHSQSLRNMEQYLRMTNRFWNWYQRHEKRLSELLSEETGDRSLNAEPSHMSLLELESRMNKMQEDFDLKLSKQESEMQKLREELEDERQDKETLRIALSDEIQQQKQMLQSLQSSVNSQKEDEKVSRLMTFTKNLAMTANKSIEEVRLSLNENIDQLQNDVQMLQDAQITAAEIQSLNQTVQSHKAKMRKRNNTAHRDRQSIRQEFDKVEIEIAGIQAETERLGKVMNSSNQELQTNIDEKFNENRGILDELVHEIIFPLEDNVTSIGKQLKDVHDSLETDFKERLGVLENAVRAVERRIPKSKSPDDGQYNPIHQTINTIQMSVADLQSKIGSMNGSIYRLDQRIQNVERQKNRPNNGQAAYVNSYPATSGFPASSSVPGSPDHPGSPGNPGHYGSPGLPGLPGNAGYTGQPGSPGDPGYYGSPGLPGLPGNPGYTGQPGSPGSPGTPGNAGYIGQPGSPGSPGLPGDTGNRGQQGSTGLPGNAGYSGQPGFPGHPGGSGLPGGAGYQGETGWRGTSGPRGAPGPQGPPGPAG